MKRFLVGFKNWIISNKKTLIQLFLWLLFMTLVVLFIRYLDRKQDENNLESYELVENLNTMNDYIYECLYNDVIYTGRVFENGTEEMYVEENGETKTLYYDKEWYELVDGERVSISEYIPRKKPKEIYEIIKLSNFVKKENDNNFLKIQFEISARELGYDNDNMVYTNVYLKDDKIAAADILGQYCVYNLVEGE